MSIFDDSLRIWGNLQAYGNIEGVEAFMRDFETKTLENIHLSTVLKKAKKLDDVSKPENCFDGSKNVDSSKEHVKTNSPMTLKNIDREKSRIKSHGKINEKSSSDQNNKYDFRKIEKHISDENLLAATKYCFEKGDMQICSIDENHIELETMREENIFIKAEAITSAYKLKGQVEEKFGVKAKIFHDLFRVKMSLKNIKQAFNDLK